MLKVWLEELHCTTFHEVGIAYVSFVLGLNQAWCNILGHLAPMLCRHWCSCFPSYVEIRKWRLWWRYPQRQSNYFGFSSKSVSIIIAYNTCVGYDFVDMSKWTMVTGELLWQWIGKHLPGCGDGGGLGVRAAFYFGALRLGYLWLYGTSYEWLRLL